MTTVPELDFESLKLEKNSSSSKAATYENQIT